MPSSLRVCLMFAMLVLTCATTESLHACTGCYQLSSRSLLEEVLSSDRAIVARCLGGKSWEIMRVFKGSYYGEEVDPKEVDWTKASPKTYFFRQEPGANNAMASVSR